MSLDGLRIAAAKGKIIQWLETQKAGTRKINYKLRDWLFSRQRYWGEPFPIVWINEADYRRAAAVRRDLPVQPVTFTENGVTHYALPLPDAALPLALPDVQSYLPSGTGESPLANETSWLEIWLNFETGAAVPASQPRPAGDAWVRRAARDQHHAAMGRLLLVLSSLSRSAKRRDHRQPGGAEILGRGPISTSAAPSMPCCTCSMPASGTRFSSTLGIVPQNEPFRKLFHQGIILGEDGQKMSKSRGNVVNPDDIIAAYGADSLRLLPSCFSVRSKR